MLSISKKSFYTFLFINTFFLLYGVFEYTLFYLFYYKFFTLIILSFMRNSFLYSFLNYKLEKYESLHSKNYNIFDYKENVINISLLDGFVLYFLLILNEKKNIYTYDFLYDALYFIPKSFIFEIIFDFFHYITHYSMHKIKFLYNHIHSVHHSHSQPTLVSTYNHHICDLLCTNVMPFYASFFICVHLLHIHISSYLLFVLYISKVYLELCGHSGKNIIKSGSFIQCIWLPQILGIDLYSVDHYNHHKYNNCNYSKRFSLWDRVFGTYK